MFLRRFVFLSLVGTVLVSLFLLNALETPKPPGSSEAGDSVEGEQVEALIWPNTKLGDLDLSNLTLKEARERIDKYRNKETLVSLPHKAVTVTYGDLGVSFKTEMLNEYTRNCYRYDLLCRDSRPEPELGARIIEIDEEKFNNFLTNLNEEVKALLSEQDVSFSELDFKAHGEDAFIEVDEQKLRSQLSAEKVFTKEVIKIETKVEYPSGTASQDERTKELVSGITSNPLLIKYGRQPVYIQPETLRSFIDFRKVEGEVEAYVLKEEISTYLDLLDEEYSLPINLERKQSILSIAHALLFRAGGEPPQTAVILPLKGQSETKGEYADKYLELNKSQQRMYAFENGELVETYIVGTGLTWETPAGEYQVLRKEGTAISYTGNWYMPYYMPIGTVNGYFFGFHEIPFRKTASGQITSRDVNTMGSPATGGCIQLYNQDAVELYEWADVGMPVVIYES